MGLNRAKQTLARRGCTKTVLYLWLPRFEPALRLAEFDVSCYHLEDEYSFSRTEVPIGPVEKKVLSEVDQVFLLSPANVEVTAEDKARIAERGFFNQS